MITINNTLKSSINYGKHLIEFEVFFSDRKTLEINVHPDMQVTVKAPVNEPIEKVINRVKRRAAWILKQKDFFLGYTPKLVERKYISGETHRYLGKQYRLKIRKSSVQEIKLKNGYFQIYVPDKNDKEVIEKLLMDWYFTRANMKFQERLEFCYQKVKRLEIGNIPKFQIRKMSKRWGSCTNDKRLILNLDLIKAPSCCIDYVIIHELCHFKHRNHDYEFFNLLYQILPDWEKRKDKLEKIVFS
jgi:predicted metal-dependent hydrolase